jgi:hypothetical protein
VAHHDSFPYQWVPHVACGGGKVWCAWHDETEGIENYTVFASCWDSAIGAWGPEMRVSPADGGSHWFSDIAVDSSGLPWVVWCEFPRGVMLYNHFDGTHWSDATVFPDTTGFTFSGAPRIAIDGTGKLHVAFDANPIGSACSCVFYTMYDGAHWSEPQKVSNDTLYEEPWPAIAANGPSDVWVAWERDSGGYNMSQIYAAHCDGTGWSHEERLDGASVLCDETPSICLDQQGLPWVVWDRDSSPDSTYILWGNRMADVAVTEPPRASRLGVTIGLQAYQVSARECRITYRLPASAVIQVQVYALTGRRLRTLCSGRAAAGDHQVAWDCRTDDGKQVSQGVCFCRLATGKSSYTSKLILTIR